ncbi:hypothetical protein [Actinomadura harenae]|uniref:Mce-associated membrane protein n=1 Tax=Actinomadura harenae TaxID=2483351 RepID=A0A3M2MDC8_9ACTN|nr:hypothetical protein [Actinomadura harenae]RMI47539.1 hypothetical protein EBO15_01130 [Actinomadura harenae]
MTTDINAEERARRAQEAKLKAEITRRMAEEAAREAEEAEREAEKAAKSGDAPEAPEKPAEALADAKPAEAADKDDEPASDEDSASATEPKPEPKPEPKDVEKADDTPDEDAEPSADSETITGDAPKPAKDADTGAEKADTPGDEVEDAPEADDGKSKGGRRKRASRAKIIAVEDDETDETDEVPGTEAATTAKVEKRRRTRGLLSSVSGTVWALIVVNLALAVALGGFLYGASTTKGGVGDKEGKQVQFAATRAAEDISSYDYRTIDSDLKRAAGHTTGNFKTQFDQQITQVKTSAVQQQAVVEGQAVKTAVESVDGDKAIALVYLDQTTAKQATASRTPNQYTLRMVMKKTKGQWLVSDLQML